MEEIWKVIQGYSDYFISNLGRIKSTKRGDEKLLKYTMSRQNIQTVSLRKDNKANVISVKTLVAQHFLNYTPNEKRSIVINHKDKNPLNCCVDNIEIISAQENRNRTNINKYGHIIDTSSKEYHRLRYILKREKITKDEYFSNIEKYNVSRIRKIHLDYKYLSPDYLKNIRLSKKYGIDLEEYNRIVKLQQEKCVICNRNKKLYVDHDHITGKTRELLCGSCNTALGFFKDNIDIMQKAIEYVKKHNKLNNQL